MTPFFYVSLSTFIYISYIEKIVRSSNKKSPAYDGHFFSLFGNLREGVKDFGENCRAATEKISVLTLKPARGRIVKPFCPLRAFKWKFGGVYKVSYSGLKRRVALKFAGYTGVAGVLSQEI